MAAAMDHLFGIGEGRVLMRGVAAALHQSSKVVTAPGGARKVVYLSGVPGNLVNNYRTYFNALHGRIAWRQAGHGSQSLTGLASIGRRLTDVSFVVFLLLFDDILRAIIKPYALLVQGAVEPWFVAAAAKRMFRDLNAAREQLIHVRTMFAVLGLCRQHVSPTELRSFFRAQCYTRAGRTFPSLFRHIFGLVEKTPGVFQQCTLLHQQSNHRDSEQCFGSTLSMCCNPSLHQNSCNGSRQTCASVDSTARQAR